MHRQDVDAAFSDGGGHSFDRAVSHVADGEDTRHAGLEREMDRWKVRSGEDEPLVIAVNPRREASRCAAGRHEDEQGSGRDGAGPARCEIVQDQFLQPFGAVGADDGVRRRTSMFSVAWIVFTK